MKVIGMMAFSPVLRQYFLARQVELSRGRKKEKKIERVF